MKLSFILASLVLPLCIALFGTVPIWIVRMIRGRFLGVQWSRMSMWHAIGDFNIIFTLFVVLANLAQFYRPLSECFSIALGHRCDLPGSYLLFSWGFFFQIATFPLGIPLAMLASIEVLRRIKNRT